MTLRTQEFEAYFPMLSEQWRAAVYDAYRQVTLAANLHWSLGCRQHTPFISIIVFTACRSLTGPATLPRKLGGAPGPPASQSKPAVLICCVSCCVASKDVCVR